MAGRKPPKQTHHRRSANAELKPPASNDPKTLKDALRAIDLEGVDLSRDQTPARDIDFD